MGMFDDLTCKYPLPVGGANDVDFQTKDTPAQHLDKYEIREDGTLWHEAYDIEDKSDPNAESLVDRVMGCCSPVNKRWEPEPMTGEVRFYESSGKWDWLEFSAYFVKGQLKHLETIESKLAHPPPPDAKP